MSENVKQALKDNGYEEVVVFDEESYDIALIGVSTDNQAVYSYERMIEWCMAKHGWTREEAIDWIEYNAIGSLPSLGKNAPIVVHELTEA